MRLLLVGPPGAGKGTQATVLATRLGVPHISTGAIFRDNAARGTELGALAKSFMDKGDLVPDYVTNDMVKDRLTYPDVAPGFLLDGYPRNVGQAEVLDEMLADSGIKLDVVLELTVDRSELEKRITGRRTCRSCGHTFHLDFDPPRSAGICDQDGGELFQRDDDTAETFANRMNVYDAETAPILSYYTARGLLVAIDAMGAVDEVTERALAALADLS